MCPPAGSLSSRVRAPPRRPSRPPGPPPSTVRLATRFGRVPTPGPTPRPVSPDPVGATSRLPVVPGRSNGASASEPECRTSRVPVVRPRPNGASAPEPEGVTSRVPVVPSRSTGPAHEPEALTSRVPVVAPTRPARTQVRSTAARPAANRAYPGAVLVPATEGLTERMPVVPPRPSTAPTVEPATTRVPHVPAPSRNRRPEDPRPTPPAAGTRTPPAAGARPAPRPRPASAPSTPRRATFASVYLGGLAAPKRTLRDILEATARAHPHAAAVDDGRHVLDYAALLREVDTLGVTLGACGIGSRRPDRHPRPVGHRRPVRRRPRGAVHRCRVRPGGRRRPRRARRHGVRRGRGLRRDRRGARRDAALDTPEARRAAAARPERRRLDHLHLGLHREAQGCRGHAPQRRRVRRRRGAAVPAGPPARHARPGARRPVRRLRRLLRGDVAGLAARCLPGARTALTGPLRGRPGRLARRAADLGRLDRADARGAVAQRAAAAASGC